MLLVLLLIVLLLVLLLLLVMLLVQMSLVHLQQEACCQCSQEYVIQQHLLLELMQLHHLPMPTYW